MAGYHLKHAGSKYVWRYLTAGTDPAKPNDDTVLLSFKSQEVSTGAHFDRR